MTPQNPLQELHDLDRTSIQFHEELSDFIRGHAYRNALPSLQSENLAWLVEYLDSVLLDISDKRSPVFHELLHELRTICGTKEVLPKSCTLSESLLGCEYEGTFDGSKVRIQRVRVSPGGDTRKAKKIFHQVAVMSKHLAHQNIVPLLGVTTEPLELISDWMSGGELPGYITNHPCVDRLSLLSDIAEGLHCLHSCDVIHGDLKGSNVLVDATGRARITDFGVALITQDLVSIRSASLGRGQNTRWIAPEILDDRGTYSKEADVFSFAGVTIEVFTGATPFDDKLPHAARLAIIGGDRPPRPAHPALTDGLWVLVQRCWDQKPHFRPTPLRISSCFGIPAWKRVVEPPLVPDGQISLVIDILSDREETDVVKGLSGDDAQTFVDVVDKVLDSLRPQLRQKCLSVLCKMCGRQALLPRSLQIPFSYERSDEPLYTGGFADVWKGEHEGTKVAVKVLRVFELSDLTKITNRFCQEVIMWRGLRHPNLLPLLGATTSNRRFAMISEWMVNGDINEFLKEHKGANRFELLKDVTRGLIYVHGQAMVHGDLKASNILIDQDHHARLADFGLLTFTSDPADSTASISSTIFGGSTRWMSPERLLPDQFGFEDGRPTKESDCYSLGMVILEVLSGQAPFASDKELTVMRRIVDGEHPERPDASRLTDDLWRILEQCWSPQPKDRPAVETVLEYFDTTANTDASWVSAPSPTATSRSSEEPDKGDSVEIAKKGKEIHQPVTTLYRTTSTPLLLDKVVNWDGKSPEIDHVLTTAFGAEDYLDCIRNLQARGIDPISYINSLDKITDNLLVDSDIQRRCMRALRKTCGLYGILPDSYTIAYPLSKAGQRAVASGGISDVWKLTDERDQRMALAVKSFRTHEQDPVDKINKKYCKGMVVCMRAKHPNILSIEGVAPKLFEFCMVSRWMENGNVLGYATRYPGVNRLELLIGVTRGLNYLHRNDVIHGDLKSPNILVDQGGSPRLSDFGLWSIMKNIDSVNVLTPNHGYTARFCAPELLDTDGIVRTENKKPTNKADVYSLSMVIVELVTGKMPFPDITDSNVTVMIAKGKRPLMPRRFDAPGTSKAVWTVAKRCWHDVARERPDAYEVLQSLQKIFNPGEERRTPSSFRQALHNIFSSASQ